MPREGALLRQPLNDVPKRSVVTQALHSLLNSLRCGLQIAIWSVRNSNATAPRHRIKDLKIAQNGYSIVVPRL